MSNLFAQLPHSDSEEVIQILQAAPGLRIERIISQGQASDEGFWYDQPHDEWVVVLQGAATLRFEETTIHLRAGDYIHIAAHRRHRVDWTLPHETTVWLAVHYGEVLDG